MSFKTDSHFIRTLARQIAAKIEAKQSEIEACMRNSYADVIHLTDKPSFTAV